MLMRQMAETYEKELTDPEKRLRTACRPPSGRTTPTTRWPPSSSVWPPRPVAGTSCCRSTPTSSRRSTDARQAADLWVKIARWYDSAVHRTDYAIASANQALQLDPAHVEALIALEDFYRKQAQWRELGQVLARHAEVESHGHPQGRAAAGAGRGVREPAGRRRPGDARLPAGAGQRRPLPGGDQRARAAVPPHPGLGPPGRGAEPQGPHHRRRRAGGEAAPAGRRDLGRAARRQRARGGGVQGGAVGRPAEPGGAEGARTALREDRQDGRLPRGARARARGHLGARKSGWRCTPAWPRSGSSSSTSPTGPSTACRRCCWSTPATRAPTATSSACTGPSGAGTRWPTTTATTSWSPPTPTSASSSTCRWGRCTRRSCAIRSGPSRPTPTCCRPSRPTSRRCGAWPACTSRPSSGTGPRMPCAG